MSTNKYIKKLDFISSIRRAIKKKKKKKKAELYFNNLEIDSSYLEGAVFKEIFKRASVFEPRIGHFDDLGPFVLPPLDFKNYNASVNLRKRIPLAEYDVIICIPFGRMGGADKTAGFLSRSLQMVLPDAKIIILQTDMPRIDRPGWYAKGVDIIDISDVLEPLPQREKEAVLYSTVRGLNPKYVFNVNSNLFWNVLKRYGKRLSDRMKLYSYMFCYDITPKGVKAGYPAEFFHNTIENLRGTLLDSRYLKEELSNIYQLAPDIEDKLVVIKSPADGQACSQTMAELQVASGQDRTRPVILWAGRFDRQKRLDVLVKIARVMSHIDFICWGAAVLDDPPDLPSLPGNLRVNGCFEQVTDLPLQGSDLWLYTSAWDGTPNILIELGALGVPIIASAVGGVPEVIGDDRGWLVNDFENPDAYVEKINEALRQPDERIKRSKKLQQYISTQHTMDAYNKKIMELLG